MPPLSAPQRAYAWISSAILSGHYAEGEFLDEARLSQDVGTSRTPVREALLRLRAERYVDLVPHRGAQVHVMRPRELREIYQARFVIESDAIDRICRNCKGAPSGASSLLDRMEAAGRDEEWLQFAKMDQQLHSSIVQHQGNSVINEMYEYLGPRHTRLAVRTLTEATWRLETIQSEHRQLLSALEAHDADRGIDVLRRHLREIPEIVGVLQPEMAKHDAYWGSIES